MSTKICSSQSHLRLDSSFCRHTTAVSTCRCISPIVLLQLNILATLANLFVWLCSSADLAPPICPSVCLYVHLCVCQCVCRKLSLRPTGDEQLGCQLLLFTDTKQTPFGAQLLMFEFLSLSFSTTKLYYINIKCYYLHKSSNPVDNDDSNDNSNEFTTSLFFSKTNETMAAKLFLFC